MAIKLNGKDEVQITKHEAIFKLFQNIVENAAFVYEIPTEFGKQSGNSFWMPFIMDSKSLGYVKNLSNINSIEIVSDGQDPPYLVRRHRPPFSPNLRVGFGRMEKLFVNMLDMDGMDIAGMLWSKEADMTTPFEEWYRTNVMKQEVAV